MKIRLFILSLLIFSGAYSQNKFNQWNVSLGASYSAFRGIHKIPFLNYEKSFKFTVGGQVHADWGLLRRLSVGVGVNFQRHQLNITDYQYQLDGLTFTESPTQTIDVAGYYARVLIHIKQVYDDTDEEVDLYWGMNQYFISYRTYNNSADPDFYENNETIQSIPAVVGGVRYYPTDFLGIHTEVALPGPYTFSAGITFRIGGRDKFFNWR